MTDPSADLLHRLEELRSQTLATAVLVIGRDGHRVAGLGTEAIEASSELAGALREPLASSEVGSDIDHHGEWSYLGGTGSGPTAIHIRRLSAEFMLAVAFDEKRTSLGVVRLHSQRTAEALLESFSPSHR